MAAPTSKIARFSRETVEKPDCVIVDTALAYRAIIATIGPTENKQLSNPFGIYRRLEVRGVAQSG